ncbi:PPE domain-containing protein [Mycolicibacterium lutetiense]
MASLDVDPDDLRAHAARIENIRAAVHPGALPVGFSPAGSDPASVLAANSISAQAALTVNGLWSVWRKLGEIADKLRPTADGYQSQDADAQANLSSVEGSWSSGTARPQVPTPTASPVAVPHMYTATPAASPEQLSTAIHTGPGATSPETFSTAWSDHAGTVETAASDLQGLKGSLGSNWSGDAHDGAASTVSGVHSDLVTHSGSLTKVSGWASTHAADFRTAVDPAGGIPHPNQFAVWNQNLSNAVAADSQYPGMYSAAVLQAQTDLNQGYTQTGTAYGQYAIDPVTGQAVDPITGEPIDPVTGEPLGDGVADAATDEEGSDPEQMLSMGGQLLTGLLGGALGAVGAGVGAIAQAGQQGAQMATSSLGQIAKSAASASEPDIGDTGLGDDFGGGAGDFGGGGGGGGTEPAAAALGPSVGTASAPPSVAPQTPAGPSVRGPGGPSMGGGMGGGMGAPYMPMGGGMGAGGRPGDPKAEASPNGKKLVAPTRPNTERVIGEIEADRMASKTESRKQKMEDAKRERLAQSKASTE